MAFYFLHPILLEIAHLHLKVVRQADEGIGEQDGF